MRTAILATTLIVLVSQSTAQNSCNTAQVITPGTYNVPGIDGPEAPSPLCIQTGNASNAEWYSYTPVQDTSVVLTTDLPGSGDTRFHVFRGNCGALVCVVGDDDSGSGLTSTANFDVEGGETYRIAFDNKWSSAGFNFRLTELAPIVVPEGLVVFTSTSIPGLQGGDCVVDMNGDHLDDVVSASSTNIRIAHQQEGGGFITTNIPTTPADHTPSWSIAAGDIDGNGYNDLLYGGGQGATFMMANEGGTAFTEVSFAQYIFSQRTNMVDINNDGNLDAFVCHDVDANVSFMNDGAGNLTFGQGGFGTTCGNYGSVWIDYDNDGLMDCFVAKCGCDPVDLLMRNNGDGTFTNMAPALGFADNHQSWSSAWGDFDNDGDMDVMVGGSSSGYNKLISNNGDGTFTNVTPGSGFDTFTGQSIEWTTHDFNNDGFLDILGGGAIMYGNGAMFFAQGPSYPGSGAIGDLNNDGFLDVMAWNSPMINGGNDHNWLKVNTIGTISNTNGIGARVIVTSALGSQIRDVKSGDAFSTMSSLTTHFGLGTDQVIEELRIQWPSGIVTVMNDVPVNTTVNVTEELSTAVMEGSDRNDLRVYPNPTEGQLFFELPTRTGVRLLSVFDMTGKCVMQPVEVLNTADVSGLASGMYLLRVQQDGEVFQSSFSLR
ncbi:MAG: VCBS repeat-containing protein [Flavobacteriales bacterium]|nr:VCBS repeat-containing protein [Flavobacteriales bacterium]